MQISWAEFWLQWTSILKHSSPHHAVTAAVDLLHIDQSKTQLSLSVNICGQQEAHGAGLQRLSEQVVAPEKTTTCDARGAKLWV